MNVDVDQCRSWKKATVDIMMIVGMSSSCCSVGVVTIPTEEGGSAKNGMLVACGKPLGFDLLLGSMP